MTGDEFRRHVPMKKLSTLSLFFPAFNEEDNILQTIERAETAAKLNAEDYELIIIDDGSTDKTAFISDYLASINSKVRVIHHEKNKGYGAALKSGIRACQYEYIFFADGDLQFELKELVRLVPHTEKYNAVLGYREKRQDPFMRLVNAQLWNFLNWLFFGLKVKDIDCAFKLIKRNFLDDMVIHSEGAMISAELLIRLKNKGVIFKEVPVTHFSSKKKETTGAKPSVILKALIEFFTLYFGELGKPLLKEAFRFGIVGSLNTAVDIGAYTFLTREVSVFSEQLFIAKAFSFLMASVMSFILNRKFTFKKTSEPSLLLLVKFYTTVLLSLTINLIAAYIFIRILGIYDITGILLATGVSFLSNFILSKKWVFSDKEKKEQIIASVADPS